MSNFLQDAFDLLSPEQQAEVMANVNAERDASGRLDNIVATLHQWALDANNTTVTSQNAVATLNVVVKRLGTFFDRFADLLVILGRD